MGANLITREEYKAYKNISSPNQDTEIDALLAPVSEFVKRYCACTFVDYLNDAKTEYFNGGYEFLILKETPVVAVNSVEYSSDFGQTYSEIVEFVDWVLDGDLIIATAADGFKKQLRGYKVTYTAGYESIPEDLKLAVFDLLTYYRQNDSAVKSTKAPGTNSVQIEYISTTSLPAHIRRVLDLYKSDFT